MSDFFGNRISGRKNAKCRVPTLAADVSFCTGRERIIEPLFAQQKLGSPKRRKKKLFPTVKSRASNELREPHQRSKKCEMQSTHPRRRCLFLHGARADNRTAFCAAKTWFAETAEKETFSDREVASKQRIAGTAPAVAIRRGAAYPPSHVSF
ncbi:MAG: hypothetical protein PUA50_02700 [Eubacteriales bacterium]|nr:hypothetical protein [Eubacteriales bacterium]